MRTIDRHILKEWLTIFAIVIGATYGLLLLFEVNDSFRDLLRFRAGVGEMLFYYAVVSPSFVSYVLPIAVLVSLLYAFGQLHRNNEIIALRSAGVGLWSITRSIWGCVALLSVLLFHLNSSVVPWSIEQARLIKTNLEFNWLAEQGRSGEEIGVEYSLGYHNRTDRRLWMISQFSRYTHDASGVQVSVLDSDGREVRRILAAHGVWDEAQRGWTFFDGIDVRRPLDPDRIEPRPFTRLELPEFHEDPEWMALLLEEPKDLSLYELARIMASPDTADPRKRAAYAVRYHWLLAGTFGCVISAGFAIPFAVSGVRVNPAVGVSKALGLFALYWLIDRIGKLLGEQQVLAPWAAAWLPILAMTAVAGWLMWRER